MTEMTPERAAQLLAPFPPEQIGQLPRVTCKNCSDKGRQCTEHERQWCDTCRTTISTRHIHLDYVGHADVTRRLLEVDPSWSWDAFALDERGLPLLDVDDHGNPVGLWIRLTVCGVTRPGYGSCPSGQGDAVKVLIGDALRNGALRFGVAVDLWAKGDRAAPSTENATSAAGKAAKRNGKPDDATEVKKRIVAAGKAVGIEGVEALSVDFLEWSSGKTLADASLKDLTAYLESLQRRPEPVV